MFPPCNIPIQPVFVLTECETMFEGWFDIPRTVIVLDNFAAPVSPIVSACTIFTLKESSIHFDFTYIDISDCTKEDFQSFQMVSLQLRTRDQI